MVLYKDSPSGSDAYIYVHEAMWVQDNDQLAVPYSETYAGADAYVSPMTATNLFLLSEASGQNIDFPVTTFYQISVIVLLVVSLSLVALTTKSWNIVLLTLINLLSNVGLYVLNVAVTLSNLLAFVLVQSIILTVWWLRQRWQWWQAGLLAGQILALVFLHRYLTAPLFLFTLVLYGCVLLLRSNTIWLTLRHWLQQHRRFGIIIGFSCLLSLGLLYVAFQAPFYELNRTFILGLSPSGSGRFHLEGYINFIGQPLFWFGIIGFISFPIRFRVYWQQFGLLWTYTLLLISLPLLQFVGVNFYFERITFLIIPLFALFAGIMLDDVLKTLPTYLRRLTVIGLLLTTLIIGIQTNQRTYLSANFITPAHTAAYRFLQSISKTDEIILSNANNLSETHLDASLSHRTIRALSLNPESRHQITPLGLRQGIIRQPNNHSAQQDLFNWGIRFVVIEKRFSLYQDEVPFVVAQYRKSKKFHLIFKNDAIEIYQLEAS